jgi:hypothetical protein
MAMGVLSSLACYMMTVAVELGDVPAQDVCVRCLIELRDCGRGVFPADG